jgi:quercetin dioxygenase-like cupin family protein
MGKTREERWSKSFEGRDVGSGVSVFYENLDEPGSGPPLHRHPYVETFVVRRGRALFTLGDEQREGGAGDVVVVPAGTPHKFAVIGPDTYEAVHIHESDHFITEWLESE